MAILTRVAITGANGRMGKELLNTCFEDNNIELVSAIVRTGSSYSGAEVAGSESLNIKTIRYSSQNESLDKKTDVLIDFTLPDNTLINIQNCIKADTGIVIGTTGFTTEQQLLINSAATMIPVLQSSNMSIGVNVTMALLKQAAILLGNCIPVKITEIHHTHKKDSPSGTAISMADVIADTYNKNLDNCLIDKTGTENPSHVMKPGFIYVNSIRKGEVVGDHSVSFMLEDEQIEISHKTADRKIFAQGAIKAAHWLAGKKPGMYSMNDILGI